MELNSIAHRIQDWKLHRTPWVASDLVSSAFVIGRPELAVPAAQFIIDNPNLCPLASVMLARKIINPSSQLEVVPDLEKENAERLYHRIHVVRKRLQEEPRNSIQWVELARLQTIVGQLDRAERAIRIACALSPSNRFVLRAAARLFIHTRTPESALKILQNATSIRSDPWLLAAEIGVECFAGRPSRFAKAGFSLLEGKELPPFSTTELASSLATLEMQEGSLKKAKKYFRRSLIQPTENSVAQAEWASNSLGGLEVGVQNFNIPRPFEAQALDTFREGKWDESFGWSKQWHWDEPFSARPAILASFIGSGPLERYEESIQILKNSMIANRDDPALMNNLAFALASLGQTAEAEEVISKLDDARITTPSAITLIATRGLICFRKGMIEKGRQLYLEAMNQAQRKGELNYRAMAAVYLAREEVLSDSEESEMALKRAVDESRGQETPELMGILSRILKLGEDHLSKK